MEVTQTLLDRFEAKYIPEPNSGCWLWTAALTVKGYSTFNVPELSTTLGHRVSYRMFKGEIPNAFEIDHLCRMKCCVNPDHLEAVTVKENIRRNPNSIGLIRLRQTHCHKGHEFSTANVTITKKGARRCKECHNEESRRRYLRDRNVINPRIK